MKFKWSFFQYNTIQGWLALVKKVCICVSTALNVHSTLRDKIYRIICVYYRTRRAQYLQIHFSSCVWYKITSGCLQTFRVVPNELNVILLNFNRDIRCWIVLHYHTHIQMYYIKWALVEHLYKHVITTLFQTVKCVNEILLNSSPPSAAYMRQWIGVSIGSNNGLSPIRRQAII